ncbi:hypothetical protein SB816_32755, partial [Achromobacter sp. SIMBA_011]
WTPIVHEWLDSDGECELGLPPRERDFLQVHEIAAGPLGMAHGRLTRSDEMRIGKILREMGYSRQQKRVAGRPVKVWVKSA